MEMALNGVYLRSKNGQVASAIIALADVGARVGLITFFIPATTWMARIKCVERVFKFSLDDSTNMTGEF